MTEESKITDIVSQYYSSKLEEFGNTPRGVDWNSIEAQSVRFEQLCRVIQHDGFTMLDYGCGYGALYTYLKDRFNEFEYAGYDISEKMRNAAQDALKNFPGTSIEYPEPLVKSYDYVIASGIFNVKLEISDSKWVEYVYSTLAKLNTMSSSGFAFNMLTKYSDPDRMSSNLYYADPLAIFDFCKKEFSRNIALLHDYDLYEFTIIVRKFN